MMNNTKMDVNTYDLTHVLFHGMPVYWTEENFHLNVVRNIPKDHYEARYLEIETHNGTHMDAPRHIIENGRGIDSYSFYNFTGNAIVINLTDKGSYTDITQREIFPEDLEDYEEQIKLSDIIILNTGWSRIRGITNEYMFRWPYLDVSGAKYLSKFKLKMICIDAPSIAGNVRENESINVIETHKVLLQNDILITEELNLNYDIFKRKDVIKGYFVALPLKILDGDGSPTRAFLTIK